MGRLHDYENNGFVPESRRRGSVLSLFSCTRFWMGKLCLKFYKTLTIILSKILCYSHLSEIYLYLGNERF